MSRTFNMNDFLCSGDNLIAAELLCNAIDDFIEKYFEEFAYCELDDGRYCYCCPPKDNSFEIGFGHEDGIVFDKDEQQKLSKILKNVLDNLKDDYPKKDRTIIKSENWVCVHLYYNDELNIENLKKMKGQIERSFSQVKNLKA